MPYLTLTQTVDKIYKCRRNLEKLSKGLPSDRKTFNCEAEQEEIDTLLESIKGKLFFSKGDIIKSKDILVKVLNILDVAIVDTWVLVYLSVKQLEPIIDTFILIVDLESLKDQLTWKFVESVDNN